MLGGPGSQGQENSTAPPPTTSTTAKLPGFNGKPGGSGTARGCVASMGGRRLRPPHTHTAHSHMHAHPQGMHTGTSALPTYKVQQDEDGHLEMAPARAGVQRRRPRGQLEAVTPLVPVLGVGVGAAREERAGRLARVVEHGDVQGRVPARRRAHVHKAAAERTGGGGRAGPEEGRGLVWGAGGKAGWLAASLPRGVMGLGPDAACGP